MKRNMWLKVVFVLLALMACSSMPKKRSMGEVIDDSVITNKLKVKFLKDKVVKGFKIDIDTWKGVVSLQGKVDNQQQINRAIDIAERQPGVREVKSYLIVAPSESGGHSSSAGKKHERIEEQNLPSPSSDTEKHFEDEAELDAAPHVTGN